ncbi:hypothetical protein BO221_32365 [Archangium sp. Cb G35]|uniref:GTP-binding protein n=1 Tax=Archangium sp. Cb G35 TaxID=1920190 RepID=UPI0009356B64|nr:hypothetical protein [Archangium sp. Cb G35]OJT19903.1 hypothetical protein BO221_32365 [Archangium sp. Cb G35]
MFLDHSSKEINIKVVYDGPELAGKKASFQYVRSKLPSPRGVFLSQPTIMGRTDFFDFVPPGLGEIRGFKCRIHVFIVLENGVSEYTRRLILKGVDGVIFVADSQRHRAEANLSSLKELESNLAAEGYDSAKVSRVYSYNKRDLPDALPVAELEERLNPQRKYPSFETIASRGVGVVDPLKAVIRAILVDAKGGSLH